MLTVPPEERVTLVFSSQTSKNDDADKAMLPEKPPWLSKVMLELPVVPWDSVRMLGLAEIEKSGEIDVFN